MLNCPSKLQVPIQTSTLGFAVEQHAMGPSSSTTTRIGLVVHSKHGQTKTRHTQAVSVLTAAVAAEGVGRTTLKRSIFGSIPSTLGYLTIQPRMEGLA